MHYAQFADDGRCTAIGCGPSLPDGAMEISADYHLVVDTYRDMYDESWHLKGLAELQALGRWSPPEGMKLNDKGEVVPMNIEDLVAAKLLEVDDHHVLQGTGDAAYIRGKHELELWRDGIEQTPAGIVVEADETVPVIKLRVRPKTYDEQVATGELAPEVAFSLKLRDCEVSRKAAYADETDPLLAQMTLGEVDSTLGRIPTKEDIEAKKAEIKARFPKPEE